MINVIKILNTCFACVVDYVAELMEVTLQICGQSGIAESNFIQMQPPPLSDTFERPDKSEAILQHTSRFKS